MEIVSPDLITNIITFNNNNIGWEEYSNTTSFIKLNQTNQKYYFRPNDKSC